MFWYLRQYSFPLLLALALHSAVVVSLWQGWNSDSPERRIIEPPRAVHAALIELKSKAKPKPPAPPKVQPAPAPQPEPQQAAPAPPKPQIDREKLAREKAEREAAEREKAQQEAERQAREQRLQELANQSFADALVQEDNLLQASEDDVAVQSYVQGIYQLIAANWSRPPSARNGMQAVLQVSLVPTGDVVSVNVVESSGNGAFDRSAEAAINKARRFTVPEDPTLFERNFRSFRVLFRPEDLLR